MARRASEPEQESAAIGERSPYAIAPPSDAVLDRVAAAFQPYSPTPLDRADAREITANLVRFFDVLQEWALEDAAKGRGPWAGLVELNAEQDQESRPCPTSKR